MKRWLLAVAALLCGAVGISHADYMIIKYNLSAERENQPQGPMGFPGAAGPGAGGSAGAGGPGAGGSAGAAGPGAGGSAGAAGPGAGGSAGMMRPGMMGPGMMQQPGQQGEDTEEVEISPLWVVAVVELKVPPRYDQYIRFKDQPGYACKISHKWGITWLQKSDAIEYAPLAQANKPVASIAKQFESKLRALHQEKPAAETYADLAEWALSHGLLPQFHELMEEFGKAYPNDATVVAYQKRKADLEKPAASNHEAPAWRSKLGIDTFKIAEPDKGHYTVLHNAGSSNAPEVQSRLARMETAFASFYYWTALRLKDKADRVKVPEERLLAIIIPQPREFDRLHDLFDDEPLVADGFLARRDNLLIYSALRRDHAYEDLRNYADAALRGADASQLLNGRGDNNLQTLLLMEKALEEDGELSTVSHEGPRQLLAASGLLPRHVEVPRWVEFGIGSFFGTPKGSPWQTEAIAPASLIEADNYLYTYKVWQKGKKLDDPKTALQRVVTDQYFRATKGDKDAVALQKARTLSWALTYFLAQRKLPELLNFFGELSRLPRDLEFDDQVLFRAFARAFDLLDPRTNQVDQLKLARLAQEWDEYISRKPVEFEEIIKELHKSTTKKMSAGQAGQGGAGMIGPGVGGSGLQRPGQ